MADSPKNGTIALVSSIVVAVFTAALAGLGYLGRESWVPEALDKLFGISGHVLKTLTKRVDSGYSGAFMFGLGSPLKDARLLFYAKKDQRVVLSINFAPQQTTKSTVKVFIDKGGPWTTFDAFKDAKVSRSDISDQLHFDLPGDDMHFIRFVPDLDPHGSLLVEALILVYATKNEDKE